MPLWLRSPLVLASQSAVRRTMLEAAGIPVETMGAVLDERAVEARLPDSPPDALAMLLAREKARTVAAKCPGRAVLGADQILAMNGRRFSKAQDRASARDQLMALAGRAHALYAAAAVVRDDMVLFEHVGVARLTMRSFSAAFLESYLDLAGSAVTSSVGGYQVESLGIQLFDRIEGDHFTILGLPLVALLDFFRRDGWLAS